MTRTTDTRVALLEHAERARQRARFERMSDAELEAIVAEGSPEEQAWLESLDDAELQAVADDGPEGRAVAATAPLPPVA